MISAHDMQLVGWPEPASAVDSRQWRRSFCAMRSRISGAILIGGERSPRVQEGSRAPSRQEALAKLHGNERTVVVGLGEEAKTHSRDEVVGHVPEAPRHETADGGEGAPTAAEAPQDVEDRRRGAHEVTFGGFHADAVGQAGTLGLGDLLAEGCPLERREAEALPTVRGEDEATRPVTQAAPAVVEEDLRLAHPSRNERSIHAIFS